MNTMWQEIKNEVWQPLTINRKYAVSSLGRVASASLGMSIHVLHPSDNGKGYKIIGLRKPKRQNHYVHRLVAEAFIQNPDGKPEVNHKDGNKSNNRVSNLEWVTLQENRDHSRISGFTRRGDKHPYAKLSENDVLEIRATILDNPGINRTGLGRKYGVGFSAINKIEKGKNWKHL